MNDDLPFDFKGYEISVKEINKGEGDWEAHVRLQAGYGWELVPGGPFLTCRAAHKKAIDFLILNK